MPVCRVIISSRLTLLWNHQTLCLCRSHYSFGNHKLNMAVPVLFLSAMVTSNTKSNQISFKVESILGLGLKMLLMSLCSLALQPPAFCYQAANKSVSSSCLAERWKPLLHLLLICSNILVAQPFGIRWVTHAFALEISCEMRWVVNDWLTMNQWWMLTAECDSVCILRLRFVCHMSMWFLPSSGSRFWLERGGSDCICQFPSLDLAAIAKIRGLCKLLPVVNCLKVSISPALLYLTSLCTRTAPSYFAWATSELAMPPSAAGKSSPMNAPEPPSGVTLPADYTPKRCRRCGLLRSMLLVNL